MNNGFRRVTIFAAFSLFFLFSILVLSLFGFISFSGFLRIATSERVITSMQLSIGAAMMATGLSLLIAIPAGYALSRYEFFGKNLVDLTLEVPMVVTPVALGALLLIFLSTRFGEFLRQTSFTFVFSFPGIVLAQFVTTVGIATRMVKTAFDGISRRYEVVACTLGATPAQAFTSVTLPMAKQGILAATVLTFAKCIGEFGATIMVAGSMPMKTETLPISIFMRLSTADIQGMAVLIMILLLIGLSALVFIKTALETSHD